LVEDEYLLQCLSSTSCHHSLYEKLPSDQVETLGRRQPLVVVSINPVRAVIPKKRSRDSFEFAYVGSRESKRWRMKVLKLAPPAKRPGKTGKLNEYG
jgi:hypothetical protein